jgi:hypothetical protein
VGKEVVMKERRRNPINPICRRRYALSARDHLRGEKNGNAAGMRSHVALIVAMHKDAPPRRGRSKATKRSILLKQTRLTDKISCTF